MNKQATRLIASLMLACAVPLSHAADGSDIEQVRITTYKLIDLLVEQGVLTRAKADALKKEAERPSAPAGAARAAAGAASAASTVRVPYVPEFVRKELKEELRVEMAAQAAREGWAGPGAVPEWVRGLKWEGDLRVRFQHDDFAADNAPAVSIIETNRNRAVTLSNTTEDRNRLRVRARLGLTATLDDNWAAGVRLTTGNTTDPISSNQTLGVYNDRFTAAFDRAYIRYRYGDQFNAVMGRFGNPWFGTDLVWANDIGFDGVAVQWTPRLSQRWRGFVTVGAMPIQEVELSSADKWLFGAQLGAELASGGGIGGKLGLALYRYSHIVGQTSPAGTSLNEFTAVQFAQKGNTYYNISSDPNRPLFGLASDYRIVNLTGTLDITAFGARHVLVTGDVVKNLGFDRGAVAARLGADVEPQTKGYLLRVAFGDAEVRQRGDWQVFAAYKRVERDAVLDAFTDSDFRLGGTDARGTIVGGSYGLGKNTAASLRLLSADSISGAPLSVDVLQFDLAVRF